MKNYDFHSLLEPYEFQNLACDIIQMRDKITLEQFREGRDAGIDGLYIDRGKKIVVQAKRYKQDFKVLYRDLKSKEIDKVKKLMPSRYILATSVDLTLSEKNQLKELFEGFILTSGDILGKKDLNNLLSFADYEVIERSYAKLWLPSVTVFKQILSETLHRGLFKESELKLNETITCADKFVSTRIYRKASYCWAQNNIIILSGEPGVGKTTMACMLALAHLQPNNLKGFIWANSIDDVYKVLNDDEEQVIILDDFWGSILFNQGTYRNDENRLVKLINDIQRFEGKKRLLLTTREYVLQQGFQRYPILEDTLSKYDLVCMVEDYGQDEKASILFRHLYTSNLEYEYVEYLFNKSDDIIYQRNYSPRTLAVFLERKPEDNIALNDYFDELLDYFDYPGNLWKSVFTKLSREAQYVSMLLLISSTPMSYGDMNLCYQKYIQSCDDKMAVKSLETCLGELEKTMVKSFYDDEEDEVLLKFIMPAIQDFLYEFLIENSEQWIPTILQFCNFYNQLQFLFEHCSLRASANAKGAIVHQCILHYNDYSYSYKEYDGSWKFDLDFHETEQKNTVLHRFFELFRVYEPVEYPELHVFLEQQINKYCLTMGHGDMEAQYTDLHNLPDIIVRCVKNGMNFNGENIIKKYYSEAFSVFHYSAMKQFEQVFPKEYMLFYKEKSEEIKKNLRSTILQEMDFLEEEWRESELDMLIDSVPNILKEFGLRYTKAFEEKIYEMCGRIPIGKIEQDETLVNHANDYIDLEEQKVEDVKKDAKNWLLGKEEIYYEDEQIIKIINESKIKKKLRLELIETLDTGKPYFMHDLLQTDHSLKIIIPMMQKYNYFHQKESLFYMLMLSYIVDDNKELLEKLVNFCGECLLLFIFKEEPVIRYKQFLLEDAYKTYLQDEDELHEIVFEHLLLNDGQWIRFTNIPLFIFCNAFIMMKATNLEDYCSDLFGDNFDKIRNAVYTENKKTFNIFYADYGNYNFRNYEWDGCIYRLCEEINPYHFNQAYVKPMTKKYLDKLGNGDSTDKVLNYIDISKLELEYDEDGELFSSTIVEEDFLCMLDHLSIISTIDVCPGQISKTVLKKLEKNSKECVRKGKRWKLFLYEIKSIECLKAIGVFQEVLQLIEKIEVLSSRFAAGDYSLIERDE